MQDLVQDLPQPREFLGVQEPLTLLLLVALDVKAGVGTVRTKTPYLRLVEYLGKHPQRPVGLVGRLPQLVMQFGDVAALYVAHLAPADPGVDEELHRSAVLVGRARLAVIGNVFLEEPLAELLHRHRPAALVPGSGRVAAALGLGNRGHGATSCGFGGDRPVAAEGGAPHAAVGAVLDDIVLASSAAHADAEAGKIGVPVEPVGAVGLELVDHALGDLGGNRSGLGGS